MVFLATNPESGGTCKYLSWAAPTTQPETVLWKSSTFYRDNLLSCAGEKQVNAGAQNQRGALIVHAASSQELHPKNYLLETPGITLPMLLPKPHKAITRWDSVSH